MIYCMLNHCFKSPFIIVNNIKYFACKHPLNVIQLHSLCIPDCALVPVDAVKNWVLYFVQFYVTPVVIIITYYNYTIII